MITNVFEGLGIIALVLAILLPLVTREYAAGVWAGVVACGCLLVALVERLGERGQL